MTPPDGIHRSLKVFWELAIAPLFILGVLVLGLGSLFAAADAGTDSNGLFAGSGPVVLVFAAVISCVLIGWWAALRLAFTANPPGAAVLGSVTAIFFHLQFGGFGNQMSTGFSLWAFTLLGTSILALVVHSVGVVKSSRRVPAPPTGPPVAAPNPPPPSLSRDAQRYQQLRKRR